MKFDSFYKKLLFEGRKAHEEPQNKLNRTKNLQGAIQQIKSLYSVGNAQSAAPLLRPGFIESKNLLGYSNNENNDFIGDYYTLFLKHVPVTIVPDKKLVAPARVKTDDGGYVNDASADISDFNSDSNYMELYKHRPKGEQGLDLNLAVFNEIPENIKALVYAYIFSESENSDKIIRQHMDILADMLKEQSPEFVTTVLAYAERLKAEIIKQEGEEQDAANLRGGKDVGAKRLQDKIDELQKQIDEYDEDDDSPEALKRFNDLTDQLGELNKKKSEVVGGRKLDDIGDKASSPELELVQKRIKNADELISRFKDVELNPLNQGSRPDASDRIHKPFEVDVEDPDFDAKIRPRLISKANESLLKTLLAMFSSAINTFGSNAITKMEKDLTIQHKDKKLAKGEDELLPIPSMPTMVDRSGDYPQFRKELMKLVRIEKKRDKDFKLNVFNLTKLVTAHKELFSKIPDDLIKHGDGMQKLYATIYENPIYIALLIFDLVAYPKLPSSNDLEKHGSLYEKFYEFLVVTLAAIVKNKKELL